MSQPNCCGIPIIVIRIYWNSETYAKNAKNVKNANNDIHSPHLEQLQAVPESKIDSVLIQKPHFYS